MLTALSTSLLQPGLGAEGRLSVRREAGGGKEACRGREGQDALCAVVSNSSPVCISGICRAVQFAVLSSVCVMQTWVLHLGPGARAPGAALQVGSMPRVMALA